MMKYNFPILPPLFLAALLTLAACIPFTSCTDEPPVAPPDTTTPPPPRDTTSHEFTWELDTLGADFSFVNDVYAINDFHVLVAGKIYVLDSAGKTDYARSGNGVEIINGEYAVLRVTTPEFPSSNAEMHSCYGSSPTDVWFGAGGPMQRVGESWKSYSFTKPYYQGNAIKIWGRKNSFDMFFACGNAVNRIQNGVVTRLMCITGDPGMYFYDLWGKEDGDVMVVGNYQDEGYHYIYRVKPDGDIEQLLRTPGTIGGIWGFEDKWYTFESTQFKSWDDKAGKWGDYKYFKDVPIDIRGNHENDIFLCFQRSQVVHWNGSTWDMIYDSNLGNFSMRAMSVSENAVFVVGIAQPGQYVVLLTGRRTR